MVENVLLVTVDSLRYDAYPSGDGSPLGELASEGTAFERAYAAGPATSPSFPAILTGTMPLSYGGLGPLSEDRPRLAAHLAASGLATGGFHCNPFLSEHFGYDGGFDRFEDYQHPLMGVATKLFPRGVERGEGRLQRLDDLFGLTDLLKSAYKLLRGKPRPYVSAEVITDDAVAWLDAVDDGFFGWVHYMDVHQPAHPPERYRERHGVGDVSQDDVAEWYETFIRRPDELTTRTVDRLRGLSMAAVSYVGDNVGRLLDTLRATGRLADTMVVLTSDHGAMYGEHGQYGKPDRMYDELLHVPLVLLNAPPIVAAHQERLTSLLDIPPLVCRALDREVHAAFEGTVPGTEPARKHVVAEHEVEGDVFVAARSTDGLFELNQRLGAQWYAVEGPDGLRPVPLEAVESDPEARRLRDIVTKRLDALSIDHERWDRDLDEDMRSRLEDLGYL